MTSVVIVVPEMLPVPPVHGGAVETWVHEVSQALAARGMRVAVVSRPAGGQAAGAGVQHVGVAWTAGARWMHDRRLRWGRHHPLRAVFKGLLVLGYGLAARRHVAALQPDVVYVHNDPYLAALIVGGSHAALVLHMHNDHLVARPARPLLAAVVARCDQVLCVSDHLRDRARAAFPAQAARIRTVHNAITPDVVARPAREDLARGPVPHFVYAGRLVPEKGVDQLLQAMAGLADAQLTIAGSAFFADAPATPFQRQLVRQAQGLRSAVHFTGYLPRERVLDLFDRATAVVAPSTWDEPFGLVVLEAMARGACVISTRVGGLPELVDDGRTGLLVPPADPGALRQAMARVASDPALARRLGQGARDEVRRRFLLPRLVDEVADSLTAAARGTRRGRPSPAQPAPAGEEPR